MQGLNVRPAISTDIAALVALDHGYSTDHVWQMAKQQESSEIGVVFREVRLPRPMRVSYPRDPHRLIDDWTYRDGLLVAELDEDALGYISLVENPAPASGWATDLVVGLRHRRQGVATRLLAAACHWCRERGMSQLFLEMQSKNIPAIRLATKLGSVFSGYSDRYYPNQDIALFFALSLR